MLTKPERSSPSQDGGVKESESSLSVPKASPITAQNITLEFNLVWN